MDDPPGAVRAAADLVGEAMRALLERSSGADTEALRLAFVRYRALYQSLS